MHFPTVIALLLSALFFVIAFRQLRHRSRRIRLMALAVLGVLSVPYLLFDIYYLHVLPEMAWYYEFRSWPGTEFLLIFLGAAAGALTALLPRSLGILVLFALAVLAMTPFAKPAMQPLDLFPFRSRWKDGVCLQSTPATCGPASVCTVLKFLGTEFSESSVARASFTSASGTEAWYLARWVRSKGFGAEFRIENWDHFSPDGILPAVVGVREGIWGHFIAVLETTPEGLIRFADPLHGGQTLPLAEFQRKYEFTGFVMRIFRR